MKKTIWAGVIVLTLIIGLYLKTYINALKPVQAAETKALALAKKKTSLKEIEDFHLYHGRETVYVLEGRNNKNEKIIVWLPKSGGKPITKKVNKGLSKQEAVTRLHEDGNPKDILSVRLGMENKIPLWEIYYLSDNNLINYYYVHYETGERLKQIENL